MQTTGPTVADGGEARLLGVPPNLPSLLFERTRRDAGNRVIGFTRPVYRGDRCRITRYRKIGPSSCWS